MQAPPGLAKPLPFGRHANNSLERKLDNPLLVSILRADEDLTGATFESSEEGGSKVAKRGFLELGSLRFLVSKKEALASYIRKNESF